MTAMQHVVHVDRTIKPIYRPRRARFASPALEMVGPESYALESLKPLLHLDQIVRGNTLYANLKEGSMLERCLGLRDLEEIQKLGLDTFRMYFQGKSLYAWKAVVEHGDGALYAPSLSECDGELKILWIWCEAKFGAEMLTLGFDQ